ncbi:MAG: hypothetical protein MJZ49_08770, partial [Bacteroidales bacterium]|nr:hypothetical protein [Bacteroidales bacterium]
AFCNCRHKESRCASRYMFLSASRRTPPLFSASRFCGWSQFQNTAYQRYAPHFVIADTRNPDVLFSICFLFLPPGGLSRYSSMRALKDDILVVKALVAQKKLSRSPKTS